MKAKYIKRNLCSFNRGNGRIYFIPFIRSNIDSDRIHIKHEEVFVSPYCTFIQLDFYIYIYILDCWHDSIHFAVHTHPLAHKDSVTVDIRIDLKELAFLKNEPLSDGEASFTFFYAMDYATYWVCNCKIYIIIIRLDSGLLLSLHNLL